MQGQDQDSILQDQDTSSLNQDTGSQDQEETKPVKILSWDSSWQRRQPQDFKTKGSYCKIFSKYIENTHLIIFRISGNMIYFLYIFIY